MKIAFRTDASLQIGTGHVMRCLTLADALASEGAECQFICRAHEGNLIEFIRGKGYVVHALPMASESGAGSIASAKDANTTGLSHRHWLGATQAQDAEACTPILAELQPDWLIVDHYALDARWECALKAANNSVHPELVEGAAKINQGLQQAQPERLGINQRLKPHNCKLMVIDDLADRQHACDLLLDQNFGREEADYRQRVPDDCRLLCGSQFALLRPEFAALRPSSLQRRAKPVLRELLITMGGVDKDNATGQVLQALRTCPLPADCRITVVMGATAPWLEEVRTLAQDMPWPTRVLVGVSDMAQLMADSDLAIGAAGATSWERCCLGLPTIMRVLAENQRKIAEALSVAGAAKLVHIKNRPIIAPEHFDTESLSAMSAAAAAITDGLGATKVAETLLRTRSNMRISLLCTDEQHPVNDYLKKWMAAQQGIHEVELVRKKCELSGGDILFLISCAEIVGATDRAAYRATLVLHASDLPRGRGWSPHIWQLIEGANEITLSLVEAEDKVDSGRIWRKIKFPVPKHALWDEINARLFDAEIELIDYAVNEFDWVSPIVQDLAIEPSYYSRRAPADSQIDPLESISSQFNRIRVCDPRRFPAFFELHGKKYKLLLEKIDG